MLENEITELSMGKESDGTKKLFDIVFDFYDSLINSKVLLIDEIDSKIHSLVTRKTITELTRAGKMQIIFTTHHMIRLF